MEEPSKRNILHVGPYYCLRRHFIFFLPSFILSRRVVFFFSHASIRFENVTSLLTRAFAESNICSFISMLRLTSAKGSPRGERSPVTFSLGNPLLCNLRRHQRCAPPLRIPEHTHRENHNFVEELILD